MMNSFNSFIGFGRVVYSVDSDMCKANKDFYAIPCVKKINKFIPITFFESQFKLYITICIDGVMMYSLFDRFYML